MSLTIAKTLPVRMRRDRFTAGLVRGTALVPGVIMVVLAFSLVNLSMGTVALRDGRIIGSWSLLRSVFDAAGIRSSADLSGPDVDFAFRFWLSPGFLSSLPSARTGEAGLLAALAGSAWIIGLGLLMSFLPALGTAMWMTAAEEGSLGERVLKGVLSVYRRIPHVLYGICILALFTRMLHYIPGLGLRSLGSAGVLMAVILLPRLTVMMKDEMSDIPDGIARAAYALGASWQTVMFRQVLPASIGMIAASTLRIIGGVLGLASPFIVLGAAHFVTSVPTAVHDRFTAVSVQVFQWALRPEGAYRNLAAAGALFLLIVILLLNVIAYLWRRKILRAREGLR